jgi:hypothetical protein
VFPPLFPTHEHSWFEKKKKMKKWRLENGKKNNPRDCSI